MQHSILERMLLLNIVFLSKSRPENTVSLNKDYCAPR
jgi:hypothetical protein